VERWLERDWVFTALAGFEDIDGFRELQSIGPLPQQRLTHHSQPQLDGLVLLVDELERNLHPAAQRAAARWIGKFAGNWGLTVILATHAPAFTAIDDAVYNEVRRDVGGRMVLEQIDPRELRHQQEIAARLGYDRGELSHQYRAILLVEGLHEQLLLEEWFADELRQARVLTVPTRGTNNLASITWALETLLRFHGALRPPTRRDGSGRAGALSSRRSHFARRARATWTSA
jgi:hypothetical protein